MEDEHLESLSLDLNSRCACASTTIGTSHVDVLREGLTKNVRIVYGSARTELFLGLNSYGILCSMGEDAISLCRRECQ